MSARIQKLRERIQKIVGVNDSTVTPVDIDDSLNDVQRTIAQRTLCLETTGTITTDSNGTANEPTGFYRLKYIQFADGTLLFPKEVDVREYDNLQRILFTNISTTVQFYKHWDGQITFFPNPAVQTYTIYYYALPTTTISSSVDPEIPEYMDEALQYGALSQLLLLKNDDANIIRADKYGNMFNEQLNLIEKFYRKSKTNSNEVYYHET